MWETKTVLFPIPQCLWPPNLVGWWLTLSGSHPSNHLTHWSRGLARLHDKLKPLYFHYYIAYDQENWEGDDFLRGIDIVIVTWPFNKMAFQDHLAFISYTTIHMTTNLGKVVTYHEELQLIKLLDPSITWFREVTWHIIYFNLHLH